MASIQTTFASIVVAVVALLSFAMGYVVVPARRRRQETEHLAEQLRVSGALRDQRVDERLERLLRLSEAHERRISRLERKSRISG